MGCRDAGCAAGGLARSPCRRGHEPAPGPDDGSRTRGRAVDETGGPAAPAPDVRPTRSPHVDVHPAIQAVVDVLADRFPGPALAGGGTESAAAAGLLVLRGALDLGLSPYLLDSTASGRPLLSELLDRWSGAAAAGADPLHEVVRAGGRLRRGQVASRPRLPPRGSPPGRPGARRRGLLRGDGPARERRPR